MVNVEDYQRYIAKVVQKIVMEYTDFEFDREDLLNQSICSKKPWLGG